MNEQKQQPVNDPRQDANSCIAFGASLGAVGTGAALLTGITCPLCVVLAPALIGYGVWKRMTHSQPTSDSTKDSSNQPGSGS